MSPGEKPIFFTDQNAAQLQQSLFRDAYVMPGGFFTVPSNQIDRSGGGVIEFGARQCEHIFIPQHRNLRVRIYTALPCIGILVRDRAARDRLKSEFGKIGQVLYA